jgi:hypothetical protein
VILVLNLCSISPAGIIATSVGNPNLPAYAPDPLSPGLGGWAPPAAFATGAPNDDDTLDKGKNFFGATTLLVNAIAPTYIVIQETDSAVQPAGVGTYGGTPLTTAYWLPLTIQNNTGQAWSGVTFQLGFGSPSSGFFFFQPPTFDNLDFNFPALPGGGLGGAPTFTPDASAFQGPVGNTTAMQPTYGGPAGKTILWQNGIIQPGGGNTFHWKMDIPNSADIMANDTIPQALYTMPAGQVTGYTFTLAITPILVPEPSATALGLLALAAVLVRHNGRACRRHS